MLLGCDFWEQDTHLSEQADGDTGAEELAHVLGGELAEEVEDVLFDGGSLCLGVIGTVGDDGGAKVGVVDRVVDGDRELVAGVVVDHGARDTSPHRLRGWGERMDEDL